MDSSVKFQKLLQAVTIPTLELRPSDIKHLQSGQMLEDTHRPHLLQIWCQHRRLLLQHSCSVVEFWNAIPMVLRQMYCMVCFYVYCVSSKQFHFPKPIIIEVTFDQAHTHAHTVHSMYFDIANLGDLNLYCRIACSQCVTWIWLWVMTEESHGEQKDL